MNNKPEREIYKHLEAISWFDKISNDQEFFEFLEQKKLSVISKAAADLANILTVDKPIEEMTDKELKELGINTKPYEIFMIVDKNDEIVRDERGLPMVEFRKNCHIKENKEFNIHRASDFLVVNLQWKILLSQRAANKDLYPSFFEIWGGHLDLGESYEKGAFREFTEELWVQIEDVLTDEELIEWQEIKNRDAEERDSFIERVSGKRKFLRYMLKEKDQTHYGEFYSFVVNSDDVIKIDEVEVVWSGWYSPEEIMKIIEMGDKEIIYHQKYVILNYLEKQWYNVDNLKKKVLLELEQNGSSIHNEKKIN